MCSSCKQVLRFSGLLGICKLRLWLHALLPWLRSQCCRQCDDFFHRKLVCHLSICKPLLLLRLVLMLLKHLELTAPWKPPDWTEESQLLTKHPPRVSLLAAGNTSRCSQLLSSGWLLCVWLGGPRVHCSAGTEAAAVPCWVSPGLQGQDRQ